MSNGARSNKIIQVCGATFFSLLFFVSVPLSSGQAQSRNKFDISTYQVPRGFTTAKDIKTSRSFVKKYGGNKFSMITIYASTNSFGDPTTDFSSRWNQLLGDIAKNKNVPETQQARDKNALIVGGVGAVQFQGTEAVALLTNVTVSGRLVTIIGITNDEQGTKDYEVFLGNFDIDKALASQAGSSKPVEARTTASNNTGDATAPNSIIGEWSTSGSVLAKYVSSGGQYVGDASTSSTRSYKFGSNGKYEDFFAITQGYKTHTFYYRGNYTLNGNTITTTPKFYEHKINTKLQPNNDPKNMKRTTFSYAFEKNTDRNVWGIRFKGDDNNFVGNDLLYQVR